MYKSKAPNIFHNLGQQSSNICEEITSYMENISKWADELVKIVEKEITTEKESALFLLPKTPSVKRTRNRTARTLVSNSSVVNSTLSITANLEDSICTRTRGARRVASKISQLTITNDVVDTHPKLAESMASLTVGNNNEETSDVTFVMTKATTRTKPVLKNEQQEKTVSEIETSETGTNDITLNAFNTSSRKSRKESVLKRVSRTSSNPFEFGKQDKISNTPSGSSGEELDKTPIVVGETPEGSFTHRRKVSRTLSGSPVLRQSSRKVFRSLSGSPAVRSSKVIVSKSSSKSPILRSSSVKSTRSISKSPVRRASRSSSGNISQNKALTITYLKSSTPELRPSRGNRTVTIKKEPSPLAASTFVVMDETLTNEKEKTPTVKDERFFRLSKTSTPRATVENQVPPLENMETEENLSLNVAPEEVVESVTVGVGNETEVTEEVTTDMEVPKKKRKLKKDEEVKENIQEVADTVRITRTKSKAIKQMMEENETKQADLSSLAKKLLNKAKMTTVKKNQLAALLECNSSTPKSGPGLVNNLPFGNITASKSKYHLLLSGTKKLKTPLATLPNSTMKIAKASGEKDRPKPKVASRDSSAENTVRSGTKTTNKDIEMEIKLKSKKEKEEEAALKRQNVIKSKQEELKRKNELKHQMAMKQREKLEQEKYHNMIQTEKEKEERHKLILQERQMKLKEEAFKKKMLTQQKIAETVERRRMEEEARIAKLKEMEAEEQRLALEKQKEQERQEKRAQERLAQKKAREEYEMQMKQELEAERLKVEKMLTAKKCMPSASKMQTTTKRQKFGLAGEKREWDYKPRNENDYGLEDEHSEVDSEDEKSYDKAKPAVPWGKKIMRGRSPVIKVLTLEMLCHYMPCYQTTPDIYKMFKMTPSKRLKRTSSAIWNTPSS